MVSEREIMFIKIEVTIQIIGCQVEKIRKDNLANQPVFYMDSIKIIQLLRGWST